LYCVRLCRHSKRCKSEAIVKVHEEVLFLLYSSTHTTAAAIQDRFQWATSYQRARNDQPGQFSGKCDPLCRVKLTQTGCFLFDWASKRIQSLIRGDRFLPTTSQSVCYFPFSPTARAPRNQRRRRGEALRHRSGPRIPIAFELLLDR